MRNTRWWGTALALGVIWACGSSSDDGAGGGGPPGGGGGGILDDGGPRLPADCKDTTTADPVPVTAHPRLLFTAADVERLRARATDANPIWKDGLNAIAKRARANMDSGKIPGEDTGSAYSYTPYPVESYAELFAFLSFVDADEAARADDAKRARTLLMYAIDKALGGVAKGEPFRDTTFSTSNRSRWWGEGFPLTVDWIYGTLTADDKAKVRTVFLRWVLENEDASITTNNHPEPKGVTNDPALLADQNRVYWAGNNYFTAHMRNIGLMSMALDEADDPSGELRSHLKSATGAWLYMADSLLRNELSGGMAAEGFEYGPQAVGYVAQLLLALHTAGLDSKANGNQTKLTCNPYWDNSVTAYLHSVSPAPEQSKDPNYSYLGPLYSAAWYGDGAHFWAPDAIQVFGALGVYDQLTNNGARLSKLRWIQRNVAPGGEAKLTRRASANDFMLDPIMYFMLLDPSAPADPDPRPSLPTTYIDPGFGHLFARTDWTPDASWFAYNLGWSRIDHQHADGNLFQLYRKGEWLTKERTGYGLRIASSDYKNTIAIENDVPDHNGEGDHTNIEWKRGSQWTYSNDGPGKILAQVFGGKYVYALGDATQLHRSTYEKTKDVTHASRSIVWLPPDRVVVYDRATTQKSGRFKRFWLNLPASGPVNGRVASVTTPKGQKIFVSSLLPAAATMTIEPAEDLDGEPAELDTMSFRLRVEATGGPTNVRFLHVIEGADGGAASPTALATSTAGTPYQGALVNGVLLMFPVDVGPFASVTYPVPGGTVAQLVTGLEPNASYTVTEGGGTVTIAPGPGKAADAGGVLVIGTLP